MKVAKKVTCYRDKEKWDGHKSKTTKEVFDNSARIEGRIEYTLFPISSIYSLYQCQGYLKN